MLEEICSMGFDAVELGYGSTQTQIDGLRKWIDAGRIRVASVHAFCPNFVFGKSGPEIFSLCDPVDLKGAGKGVQAAKMCADFAASVGAGVVVMHAGRAPVFRHLRVLDRLAGKGLLGSAAHERAMHKITAKRERCAGRLLDALYESLEEVLPRFAERGVALALENLPTCDAIPNELEMAELLREFDDLPLRYWHDLGHGQIRQNFGVSHHKSIVSSFRRSIAGFHVHDVEFPSGDHLAPREGGTVDFRMLESFAGADVPFVLEPSKNVEKAGIVSSLTYLHKSCGIPLNTP